MQPVRDQLKLELGLLILAGTLPIQGEHLMSVRACSPLLRVVASRWKASCGKQASRQMGLLESGRELWGTVALMFGVAGLGSCILQDRR